MRVFNNCAFDLARKKTAYSFIFCILITLEQTRFVFINILLFRGCLVAFLKGWKWDKISKSTT